MVIKTCKGGWVNYNAVLSPFKTTNPLATLPFSGLSLNATSKQIVSSVSYFAADSASGVISLVLDGTGDTQVVRTNNVTTDMFKSGAPNFVSPTASFRAYLIRDSGDDIIGVVFIQEGKHT